MPTKQRLAIGRLVGCGIALCCLGSAVQLADEAWREHLEINAARTARPLETAIDLSQTSQRTVPLQQSFDRSHSEILVLMIHADEVPQTTEELQEWLAGLSAELNITDQDGNEVITTALSPQFASLLDDNEIRLDGFKPMPNGNYKAELEILSGAPKLAGLRQSVYVRYWLCGMESFPILFMSITAAVSGLIGLVTACFVGPQIWKHGVWQSTPMESTTGA